MRRRWLRWTALGLVATALMSYPASRIVRSLAMTRRGVSTFTRLLASANAGDLDAVRSLCSGRYLRSHPVRSSPEGGVVGLPRLIHRNFRAWVEGDDVWLCPTDRVGPVYRLVREGGAWKFDGLAGRLLPGGVVEPADGELANP